MELNQITIIGCGPGHMDYLTPIARLHAAQADVLIGAPHLLDALAHPSQLAIPFFSDVAAMVTEIESYATGRNVAVLVSGDPGIFSLAKPIIRHFGLNRCLIIPGISSIQCAFAAIGEDWQDAKILSAHDRLPDAEIETLVDTAKFAILAGNPQHVHWIESIITQLWNHHRIIICENLTLANQRITLLTTPHLPSPLASRTICIFLHQSHL